MLESLDSSAEDSGGSGGIQTGQMRHFGPEYPCEYPCIVRSIPRHDPWIGARHGTSGHLRPPFDADTGVAQTETGSPRLPQCPDTRTNRPAVSSRVLGRPLPASDRLPSVPAVTNTL